MNIKIIAGRIVQMVSSSCPSEKKRLVKEEEKIETKPYVTKIVINVNIINV